MNTVGRAIGPRDAWLVTVGGMIGSGVFASPHAVALAVDSPAALLAAWGGGGLLSLLGALSFVELGAMLPHTGGLYGWLARAFGRTTAFVFGWTMAVQLVPSSIAFFASVTATYVASVFGLQSTRPIEIAVVASLVAVNLLGVAASARVQSATAVVKALGVSAFGLLAAFAVSRAAPAAAVPRASGESAHWVLALVPVLWSYDGWIDVTSIAGEVHAPARNVPRALWGATLVVALVYLVVNAGLVHALGIAGLRATETPALDLAVRIAGPRGGTAIGLLAALSAFGGAAVGMLTGSRVVHAMLASTARTTRFASVSPRGVPSGAVLVVGVLALAWLLLPTAKLAEVFVIGAWPFYALGAIATVVLRRTSPELARPVRTLAYPWPIALFVLAAVALMAHLAITQPREVGISVAIVLAGVPLARVLERRS